MNLVTSQVSLASNKGIFLNESTAKRVTTDLRYCNESLPVLQKSVQLCNQQVDIQNKQLSLLNLKVDGLEKDKTDLFNVSNEYKKQFINKNNELIQCNESKPSRMVWFGAGVLSTTVLFLLTTILIK